MKFARYIKSESALLFPSSSETLGAFVFEQSNTKYRVFCFSKSFYLALIMKSLHLVLAFASIVAARNCAVGYNYCGSELLDIGIILFFFALSDITHSALTFISSHSHR